MRIVPNRFRKRLEICIFVLVMKDTSGDAVIKKLIENKTVLYVPIF